MQFIRVSHCNLLKRHPKIMLDVQVYCPVMLLAVDTITIGTVGMGKIAL